MRQGPRQIMLRYDHGNPLFPVQPGNQFIQIGGPFRIERRSRLVQHQDRRSGYQHGGHRQPLLLPAGQGRQLPLFQSGQPHRFQGGQHPVADQVRRHRRIFQCERHFIKDGQCYQLAFIVLHDQAHIRRRIRHRTIRRVVAFHHHPAGHGPAEEMRHQSGHRQAQRRLAAAVGSGYDRERPFGNRQRDPVQSLAGFGILIGKILEPDRLHQDCSSCPSNLRAG